MATGAISAGSIHVYEKPVRSPLQAALFDIQIRNDRTSQRNLGLEPKMPLEKPSPSERGRSVPVWVFALCTVTCLLIASAALSLAVYTFITFSAAKESIAFHATLGSYDKVVMDTSVVFSNVDLNLGGGYSSSTGKFTVPPGGAGVYNFQLHLLISLGEAATFQVRQNGRELCRAVGDNNHNGVNDAPAASCAASVQLEAGDEIDVMYDAGTDDTPLYWGAAPWQSFTGFRISYH